ncbi:MAG: DUF4837 family protein [Lishizhenia sp.]
MKHLINLFLVALFLFSSCEVKKTSPSENNNTNQPITKKEDPKSTFPAVGKVGQIRVVIEDNLFSKKIETALDSIYSVYFEPFKYPPQLKFEILQINATEFKASNKRFRNLMFLKIDENIAKGAPTVVLKEGQYAATQLCLYILANNQEDLEYAVENMTAKYLPAYDKMAWQREYIRNKRAPNKVLNKKIQEEYAIDITFPSQAGIVSKKGDFMRIALPDESRPMELTGGNYQTSRTNFTQYGLMIWQYDFKDSSQIAYETLLQSRDTVLKYNAPHEYDGVYMGTQYHPAILPVFKELKLNNVQGYELKGLFKFTGEQEPSGGLFWSFTFKHPKKDKIITLSSYVDGPPTTSMVPYLRRVQSILYSVKVN